MKDNNMFHHDNRDDVVSYDAYFYIPVSTEKLYVTKMTKAFDHNHPENFKFCPETGKALWNTTRKHIDIVTVNKEIVDPDTNEVLATVFERLELYAIGYKLEIGKPFSIPFEKIDKLLTVLKKYNVVNEKAALSDFKFIHLKDTFDFLKVIRKDWPRGGEAEKKWGFDSCAGKIENMA